MKNIDLHFHTTVSDWKYTNEQVIAEAKNKWLDFICVTEHDIVNTQLAILARENGIESIEWVEISIFDKKIAQKSLHITCYADRFSGDIIKVLENNRNGKINKIQKQITVLKNNWFQIDYNEFLEYNKNKWFDIQNLNNSHISEYIYLNEYNVKLIKELTWENLKWWDFIRRCLKTTGDLRHIGWVHVDDYEPSMNKVWEISKESGYFLSLAHPNFTFKNDFELFILFIQEYKDILNWIEINSLASKEWVEVILRTAKKYNMILTFWSDDHFERELVDEVHWKLWDTNPHISDSDIMENFRSFLLLVNTVKSIKKSS